MLRDFHRQILYPPFVWRIAMVSIWFQYGSMIFSAFAVLKWGFTEFIVWDLGCGLLLQVRCFPLTLALRQDKPITSRHYFSFEKLCHLKFLEDVCFLLVCYYYIYALLFFQRIYPFFVSVWSTFWRAVFQYAYLYIFLFYLFIYLFLYMYIYNISMHFSLFHLAWGWDPNFAVLGRALSMTLAFARETWRPDESRV